MIEDAPIVKDTRHVRSLISQQFDHDIDRYITYLMEEQEGKRGVPRQRLKKPLHSPKRIKSKKQISVGV
jgi:hypothetical protein